MSANIETIAWTNQTPWHGLGVKVEKTLTVPQMLNKAKINWTVSKRPLLASLMSNKEEEHTFDIDVPDKFALVRDSDHRVLDVVGKDYVPVQNKEAFHFFNDFIHAGKAYFETAGSLSGGRLVWGLANLNQEIKLGGGDNMKGYLLVASPHKQGKSFIIKNTSIRVVCNNTLEIALVEHGKAEFRMIHRTEFNEGMVALAKETLGIARENFDEFGRNVKKLIKQKMTLEDSTKFLAEAIQPELIHNKTPINEIETHSNKFLRLSLEALGKAPGQDLVTAEDTLWGTVNAVTYVSDHLIGRNPDNRLNKAWFGSYAAMKKDVFQQAMKMVA